MVDDSRAPNVQGVSSPGIRTVHSLCGMCAVRCPIQVDVEDQRAVWIQGNTHDKSMGASLCAKGAAGLSLEYDDRERPQYPLIRNGPRGSGKWRKASWPDVLDYVADALSTVIDKHGAKGVILSDRGGPFTDLTKSFLKAMGSPNYFSHDCTCGLNAHHATKSLFGVKRTGVVYDFEHAKHIVLYGRNILESLQVKEAKAFVNAITQGAKCTYIDPRANVTASKASRFWMIKPNTEYALNLAIINYVLEEQLYDKAFVSRWITGLDELKSLVEGKTPEWQEGYTGIPADEVKVFSKEVAEDAPRVIFHAGWNVARHRQSFYSSRTAHILNSLFGAIEVPGGVLFSKGPGDAGKKGLNKLGDRIPEVKEKRVDGVGWQYEHFDKGPGVLHLLFSALLSGSEPYPVGAYIVYRHDPLVSMPDTEVVKKALDKLDLLVSIDVHYSQTGWYSDVILPECTYLERANIIAQKGGLKPTFQMRDQAVAPRFDTRPAWWIFRELARRLGFGEYFDFETIEELWNYQLEGTGVTVEQLREKGIISLSDKPILWDRDDGLKFKTPSGKIELISSNLEKWKFDSLAEFQPPAELAEDEFILLFGRVAVHNHSHTVNNPLLNELFSENPLWMNPERAAKLGISDGDTVEVARDDCKALGKVKVTRWIHPNAVFMIHGFGRTIPLQTRAYRRGMADQCLQKGMLNVYDPVGGGNALCECTIRVKRAVE